MKVAIVGTGLIGNVHAQAIKGLGHEIVVAVNSSMPKAEAFAAQWSVPTFGTDFQLALSDEVDCVHICTPPALHFAMIKAALLANKHVVCEKPMCLEVQEAQEVYELAQQQKRIVAVVFNVRYHQACVEAKKIIAQPEFGKVLLVHGHYLQEFHALPDAFGWRYQTELAGKMRAVTEIGSHWIDLMRFWTGLEIAAISANLGTYYPQRYLENGIMYADDASSRSPMNLDNEDAAVISFKCTNGAIGNVLLSEISHGRSNQLTLEVTGTQQSIWWNNEHPYQLHQGNGKFQGARTQSLSFSGGFAETFGNLFGEVYAAIQVGKPPENPAYPTFKDGYINTLICEAIHTSAKQDSKWIEIPNL
ncbi:Gfo/Idh/MocA family oxidoreductase [Haliscomenobacter sp.]|uniref:Gfo/Idh/MocA family protein n=1 Tax=Haliscomenobacter sp. TaxID=2717303 RepID=UPI0033650166